MGIQTTVTQKFTVSAFSEYVRNDVITHIYVAPPVVLYLAKDAGFRREDLSSIKMITSGGAPLAPDLIRAVYERFNIPVRQAFGLTESTAVCHIQVRFPGALLYQGTYWFVEMEPMGSRYGIKWTTANRPRGSIH